VPLGCVLQQRRQRAVRTAGRRDGQRQGIHQFPALRFHVGLEERPHFGRDLEQPLIKNSGGLFPREIDLGE
jgi:hypothetical protein